MEEYYVNKCTDERLKEVLKAGSLFEVKSGIYYIYILNDEYRSINLITRNSHKFNFDKSIVINVWQTGVYEAYRELFSPFKRRFVRRLKKGKTSWVKEYSNPSKLF